MNKKEIENKLKGYDEVINYLQALTEITDDEDIDNMGVNDILMNIQVMRNEKSERLEQLYNKDFQTVNEITLYCDSLKEMKDEFIKIVQDVGADPSLKEKNEIIRQIIGQAVSKYTKMVQDLTERL